VVDKVDQQAERQVYVVDLVVGALKVVDLVVLETLLRQLLHKELPVEMVHLVLGYLTLDEVVVEQRQQAPAGRRLLHMEALEALEQQVQLMVPQLQEQVVEEVVLAEVLVIMAVEQVVEEKAEEHQTLLVEGKQPILGVLILVAVEVEMVAPHAQMDQEDLV